MTDFKNPDINLKFINGKFVDADAEYISVPKIVVDIAEYLTQLVPFASPNGKVETEDDWKIVVKLFEAFIRCYPVEYQNFVININKHREVDEISHGYVKGTDMKHQMEIPERFHQLLKTFYPLQDYSTKFTRRLSKEIPILKAA